MTKKMAKNLFSSYHAIFGEKKENCHMVDYNIRNF